MNSKKLLCGILALASAFSFVGCKEELDLTIPDSELYTRNFLETFGPIQEGHTFNLAQRSKITLKCTEASRVQILADVNGTIYKFAEREGISGTNDIEFTVPKSVNEVILHYDDYMLPIKLGDSIDLDDLDGYFNKRNTLFASSRATIDPYTPWYFDDADHTKICGWLDVTDQYINVKNKVIGSNITGWELAGYYDEFKASNGATANTARDFFYGEGTIYLRVLYWKKKYDNQDYEIGFYNTDKDIYVPMYSTAVISGGNTLGVNMTPLDGADNSSIQFTVNFDTDDYSNGSQSVKGIAGYGTTSFDNYKLYEDPQFLIDLQNYVSVRSHFPNYDDETLNFKAGSNRYTDQGVTLPPFEENGDNLEFFRAWEAFLYLYVNDSSNGFSEDDIQKLNEFTYFKEFCAHNGLMFSYQNTYPTAVIHNGGNSYTILFCGAQVKEGGKDNHATENSNKKELVDLTKLNTNYWAWGSSVTNKEGIDEKDTYVVYVKDIRNAGTASETQTVYTTAKGNTNCYGMINHIHNSINSSSSSYGVVGFKINGEDFNDVMVTTSGPGGGSKPASWDFPEFSWSIAVEDLGTIGDYDFNDLVVGVKFNDSNNMEQEIEVRPLAAGGIYPIYLAYSDGGKNYIVGKEIHSWLGVDLDIYNTEAEFDNSVNDKTPCKWTYSIVDHSLISFSLDDYVDKHWVGDKMGSFYVIVDKRNNHSEETKDFNPGELHEITGDWSDCTTVTKPGNTKGTNAPMMLCVGGDWEWPTESTKINKAYPAFDKWVGNQNYEWYGANATGEDAPDRTLVTTHKK